LCVLTFDDGWYDFHTYAFPILKEHQVPATVFLPTDFIGTEDWFWSDRLASIFYQRENSRRYDNIVQGVRNPLVNKLLNLKGSLELRMEAAIKLLKTYTGEEIEKAIKELTSRWKLEPNPPGRAFLSWEETREMAQSGLITFGSHTASHRILTTLEEMRIQDELRKSRGKLIAEKVVNPAFIPFSYPNGNYNQRIAKLVKDADYGLAVTTEYGWNHNESDPFALRRVSIHQDMTSTQAMFGCRLVGIF
ncbi:MAG: polysaccharide deacetylase family protein, partial [Proteobacteria bacterium]|nr:polysaccharide deacetylase family protein [Pseudomonadota bacterium]